MQGFVSVAVVALGAFAAACGNVDGKGADAASTPDTAVPADAGPDAAPDAPPPDAPPDAGPCAVGDDDDGDGVCNAVDVCASGDDRLDADADTVPDACDVCAGFDDRIDLDADGVPAGCATCGPDVARGLNPHLFWPLSLGGGYAATDVSGHGRDGFYIGAGAQQVPVQVPGVYATTTDPALSFNGAITRVQRAFVDFPTDAFTMSLWLNVPAATAGTHAVSFAAPGASQDNEVLVRVTPTLVIGVQGVNAPSFPTTELDVGAWRHLAFSWRRVDQMLTVYVNGAQIYAMPVGASPARPMSAVGMLMLAQDQDELGGALDPDQDLEGAIDEVLLYDRVLTAAEVGQLYNSAICPP